MGGGVRGTFSDVEPLVASHQLVGVTSVTMEMDGLGRSKTAEDGGVVGPGNRDIGLPGNRDMGQGGVVA